MAQILTEADTIIIPLAMEGQLQAATEWYFQGFSPLWYQYMWHYAPQKATTFLAGVAAGKTSMSAASMFIDCMTTPYYMALHTSVTAKQAELAYDMAMGWITDNRKLEHLITDTRLRPYPKIVFANYSEWEFRTSGTDARFIRGSEYDRIVFDEAGLDPHGEVVKVLRHRLRGNRPLSPSSSKLVPRKARLDVITSPTAALWLKERFNKGWKDNPDADTKQFFSVRATTYDNSFLTPEQVAMFEAELTEEDIAVEMRAEFPQYGLTFFPQSHIEAITQMGVHLYDEAYEALNPESGKAKSGYVLDEHPRYGITKFEMPASMNGKYVMAGDPGIDDPPKRNAGVVVVIDIAPSPSRLVYFDWVYGRGKYDPFLKSFKYALKKYGPVARGLDTTGTQKQMQELGFERYGIETDGINFGRDKDGMLNSLSLDVSNQDIVWPPIRGLIKQMSIYRREDEKKLAQDIVMALAMASFLGRYAVRRDKTEEGGTKGPAVPRHKRTSRNRRRRA